MIYIYIYPSKIQNRKKLCKHKTLIIIGQSAHQLDLRCSLSVFLFNFTFFYDNLNSV